MRQLWLGVGVFLLGGCATAATQRANPSGAAATGYDAWVVSESADEVARIHFERGVATVAYKGRIGQMPMEIDGPHGVAVAPDGRHVYVTLGHGVPFGSLRKLDAATGEEVGRTVLGLFPATVDVTPDGEYGFVANFNLHGDHVPSSISKVHLPTMAEVARTETCVMPHGSRLNRQGTRHYSACMMDELLVEIDAGTGEVLHRYSVARGAEGAAPHAGHAPRVDGQTASGGASGQPGGCSPTWAEPHPDGSRVYVTCNRAKEVLEVDVTRWEITRRIPTGESPYNLAVTPDSRHLLVSLRNRTDAAVEIYELASGRQVAHVPASTTLVHGIAVTADSRYAFVSVEGIGSEPGKVDVVDLGTFQRVASVGIGQQATGIAVVR